MTIIPTMWLTAQSSYTTAELSQNPHSKYWLLISCQETGFCRAL